MRQSIRGPATILAAIATLALIASCASGVAPAMAEPAPVPADALGWAQVADPAAALKDFEAFWKASGFDAVSDGKSFIDSVLDKSDDASEVEKAFNEIDASRPWVAALLQPSTKGGEPGMVLYFPLKHGQKSYDIITASITESETTTSLIGSWAVFAFKGEAPKQAPSSILTLPARDPANPGAMVAGGEVKALLAAYGDTFEEGIAGMGDTLETLDAGVYDYKGFLESLPELAGQIQRVELRMRANAAGVDISFHAVPIAGSPAAAYGASFAKGAGPIRHLERLENDALFSAVWSSNPEAAARFGMDYLKALGADKIFGTAYATYTERYGKVSAGSGAMSLDLGIAPDLVERLSGAGDMQAMGSILDKALSIDVRGWYDVRDAAAWRALIADSAKAELYGPAFHDFLENAGVSLDIEHRARTLDGRDFDMVSYKLGLESKLTSGMPANDARALQTLVDRLMAKLEMTTSIESGLAYTATGGAEAVQKLISSPKVLSPAARSAAWKRLFSDAPAGLRFAGKFSTRRLIELLVPYAANLPFKLDPKGFDGLYFWLSADESAFGIGYFMPSGDLRSLVEIGKSAMGGAGSGDGI